MNDPAITASNPYVGPRAFEEADKTRFFGRDRESRQLASLVIAHRAVLLYAQSGAGKTSLLRAGLVPTLQRRRQVVTLPVSRVSGDDRPDTANIFVYNTLLSVYGETAQPDQLAGMSLTDGLAPLLAAAPDDQRQRPRLLILDQFEELFTSHNLRHPDRRDFFRQLDECLEYFPQLCLLLAMREDYIAHLDPYVAQLPDRLRTRYRLEQLGPAAALAAVEAPLAGTGREYGSGVAATLVDNLRRVQQRQWREAGEEVSFALGPFVEPVHLQIVCQRLWERLPTTRRKIAREDVQQLGDVDQALTWLYEASIKRALPLANMDEWEFRDWVEAKLITSAGTRGLIFRGADETEGLPNEALDALVNSYLIRADMRAGERWYEISHDRLLGPLVRSNDQWRRSNYTPLKAALDGWHKSNRDRSALLRGAALKEALNHLDSSPDAVTSAEREFIQTSLESEKHRQQRLWLTIAITSSLITLLTFLTVFAFRSSAQATKNEQIALENQQTAIAAEATKNSVLETVLFLAPEAQSTEPETTPNADSPDPTETQVTSSAAQTADAALNQLATIRIDLTSSAGTAIAATASAVGDDDGDGLTNEREEQLGTNPDSADTDADGITDGDEVLVLATNPLSQDSDGDGVSDGNEVAIGTNPLSADTDADGIPDGVDPAPLTAVTPTPTPTRTSTPTRIVQVPTLTPSADSPLFLTDSRNLMYFARFVKWYNGQGNTALWHDTVPGDDAVASLGYAAYFSRFEPLETGQQLQCDQCALITHPQFRQDGQIMGKFFLQLPDANGRFFASLEFRDDASPNTNGVGVTIDWIDQATTNVTQLIYREVTDDGLATMIVLQDELSPFAGRRGWLRITVDALGSSINDWLVWTALELTG